MGAARLTLAERAKRLLGFSSDDDRRTPGHTDDFWYQPIAGYGQLSYRDALEIAAASAAGRAISETLGTLPLHVHRRLPGGGKEIARDHRLFRTLAEQPNEYYSAVEMWEQCIQSLLFRGNWLATYETDTRNNVVTLAPVNWSDVTVQFERESGLKVFTWHDRAGRKVSKVDSDVLHIPGSAYDGLRGYGLLETASGALGVSKRVQEYVDKHFRNMLPPVVVSFATPMPAQSRDNLYEVLKRKFAGGDAPFMVLDNGAKVEALNLKAQEMQLSEIWKHATTQIARLFRVPPHVIGDLERATFSNIEHQSQDFINMCLLPWARRIEQRLELVLLGPRERREYSIRFAFDALLRGDAAARATYYSQLFQVAGVTANEIRDHEGRNPVDGGDEPMIQGALIPLKMAGKHLEQQGAANAA